VSRGTGASKRRRPDAPSCRISTRRVIHGHLRSVARRVGAGGAAKRFEALGGCRCHEL
jgi:hypothetical protein